MKPKTIVLVIFLVLVGVALNNGIINRASTEPEAIAWAESNLQDRDYYSSYTSERMFYDETGNPVVVDVPDGANVTIHWTGDLFEKNDEWGKNWCFKMQLISNGEVIKNNDKCENLSRNSLTGKLLRD